MFEIIIKDKKIKIEKEDNQYWFSIEYIEGGTHKRPYGFLTKEDLKKIKNGINKLLK